MSEWLFWSSVLRMVSTMPSIMPEGATMSAPAFARARVVCASWLSVLSLSTTSLVSLGISGPQWPWSVYSQRQRSACMMTFRPSALTLARTWLTGASVEQAYVPWWSFLFFGVMPKRINCLRPWEASSLMRLTAWSTGSCETPGIVLTGMGASRCPTNRG